MLPVQAAARPDVEVAAPSQDHAGWTAKLRAAVTLLTPQCISLCLGGGGARLRLQRQLHAGVKESDAVAAVQGLQEAASGSLVALKRLQHPVHG